MREADSEQVVTEMLSALAKLYHALVSKAIELREQLGSSDVKHELEIWKAEADQLPAGHLMPPGAYTDVVITGYVDAPVAGARGVAWSIDLIRRGASWRIDREVTFYPNEGEDRARPLPEITCADSRELAARLSVLTQELLGATPPT